MKAIVKVVTVLFIISSVTACSGMSRTQKNTAIGAAIGGAAGHMIGESTGATLGGAALGGLISSQVGK